MDMRFPAMMEAVIPWKGIQKLQLSWNWEKLGVNQQKQKAKIKILFQLVVSTCFNMLSTQFEKYEWIKLDNFPRDRGENKKYLKPPPSLQALTVLRPMMGWHVCHASDGWPHHTITCPNAKPEYCWSMDVNRKHVNILQYHSNWLQNPITNTWKIAWPSVDWIPYLDPPPENGWPVSGTMPKTSASPGTLVVT